MGGGRGAVNTRITSLFPSRFWHFFAPSPRTPPYKLRLKGKDGKEKGNCPVILKQQTSSFTQRKPRGEVAPAFLWGQKMDNSPQQKLSAGMFVRSTYKKRWTEGWDKRRGFLCAAWPHQTLLSSSSSSSCPAARVRGRFFFSLSAWGKKLQAVQNGPYLFLRFVLFDPYLLRLRLRLGG